MGFYSRNGGLIGTTYAWSAKTGVVDLFDAYLNASPLAKIGTTVYDATGFGAVTDITEIETVFHATYPSVISGYLKYIIKDTVSTTKTIMVSFRKSSVGELSQSMFSLYNSTPSIGTIYSILYYSNDDHDTLWMDSDGKGVIARLNINTLTTSSNYDKFQGTTEVLTNTTLDSAVTFSPSLFVNNNNATPITFPATSSVIWFNLGLSTYKVNSFSSQSSPSNITTYIGNVAPANQIITISDGVNMFLIYKIGQSYAVQGKVDLTTGTITTSLKLFSATFLNGTEEDAIGAQLFAVDGALTYQSGTSFCYTPLNNTSTGWGWREISALSSYTSATIGSINTQTGMDIFGSIDALDGFVWFADWGHDDGGLFNVGNDSQLGTTKSNIQKISSTYNN